MTPEEQDQDIRARRTARLEAAASRAMRETLQTADEWRQAYERTRDSLDEMTALATAEVDLAEYAEAKAQRYKHDVTRLRAALVAVHGILLDAVVPDAAAAFDVIERTLAETAGVEED